MSAAVPLTTGVAMLVPLNEKYLVDVPEGLPGS